MFSNLCLSVMFLMDFDVFTLYELQYDGRSFESVMVVHLSMFGKYDAFSLHVNMFVFLKLACVINEFGVE